jgi:hypothetical protein
VTGERKPAKLPFCFARPSRTSRAARVSLDDGRATSALFFGEARARRYSLPPEGRSSLSPRHNEGSGAPGGATEFIRACEARRRLLRSRRHASRRSTGGISGGGFPPQLRTALLEPAFARANTASSLQSGRHAARAEFRSRPGAGLRDLPAGAAPMMFCAPASGRLLDRRARANTITARGCGCFHPRRGVSPPRPAPSVPPSRRLMMTPLSEPGDGKVEREYGDTMIISPL